MPRKPKDITADIDAILAVLDCPTTAGAEDVPPGWYTIYEVMAASGNCPRQTAESRLRRQVQTGRLEVRKFRIATTQGVRVVNHYRVT
jgi:hypothetical protein